MVSLRSALALSSVVSLTTAGCHTSFTALDLDGGTGDGGATDAQTVDAHSPDARAPDAGGCPGGFEWIDETPAIRAIEASPEPALTASADGFELFYWSEEPTPCEGCPQLTRIPTSGAVPAAASHLAYWAGTDVSRLIARTDGTGAPWFAAISTSSLDEAVWAAAPPAAGAWEAAGQTAEVGAIGDLLFLGSSVLVQSHTPATEPVGSVSAQLENVTVRALSLAGAEIPSTHGSLDPNHGFPFWAPQLARDDSGPWFAVLSNVDFPPTVQLIGPDFPPSWEGSSCGVDSFDLAPESASSVLFTEDCGSMLQVRRRTNAGGDRAEVTSDRAAGIRSRIVAQGERVIVAYRTTDGAVRITAMNRALELDASSVVPGSELSTVQAPGPLALAAHADGTVAVLWTRSDVEDGVSTHGAVQRFRLCD